MTTIQKEIQQLWAEMKIILVTLVVFPLVDLIEPVVDVFAPQNTSLTSIRNRLHIYVSNIIRLQAGFTEE